MPPFLLSNLKSPVSRLPLRETVTNMVEDFSTIRENIPAKYLSSESTLIEGIYVELNFCKKNWLLCCTYNPNRNIITNHLDALKRSLDPYSTKYDNLMVIGDLNAELNLECMKFFCETYDLSSLIKVSTCYKNPEKP